jgi:DNA-binding PadR family transcriptional regulator
VRSPVAGDDPRRRYYGLTREGRRVVRDEARRLEALVRHARAKDVLREAAETAGASRGPGGVTAQ